MRPESLRYDYDGEQVGIAVLGVAPLDTPLKAFSKGTTKVTNLSTSADTPARIYSGGYFPWIHLVDTNGVRM
ncbi:MAG: hypothetical protein ACLRM8_01140 [Alistipes sp.]